MSLSSAGDEAEGGASTTPTVSSDGRYVAFVSAADNLVESDENGTEDIFLRDRLTNQTRRVNLAPDGAEISASSDLPEISADGRFVVFRSSSTELVPGSTGTQLFLFDRVADEVRRVAAAPAGYASPADPSISADGSRVAFSASSAQRDIFVADTTTGDVRRVTETDGGTVGNGTSFDPDISGDGRWVGFTTASTNLATPDGNGFRDVVVRDLASGAFTRVSVGAGNAEPNLHSSTPALSHDGCIVAFFSSASNLVASDSGEQPKVFVRDRCGADTEVASLTNNDAQRTAATPIDLSDDGCRVVFLSAAIVDPPPASGNAAVLRDRCAGTTSRLDIATNGDPGSGDISTVSISGGTGRYAAFATTAASLVPSDGNGLSDAFLRDRAINTAPVAALSLSQDGRRVTADATASRDPDGFVVNGSIAFGDGTPAQPGLRAVHEYARGGTYSVSVTVTDADGVSRTTASAVTVPEPGVTPPPAPGPPPGTVVLPPPAFAPARLVLDRVGLSRTRFAVVPRNGRPGGTRGAQLTLRLSAPATVTLLFERARRGRRVRGRCVVRARRGPRCTRYGSAGTITRALPAGTSTIAITGRFGARGLKRGAHRLSVRARSADGGSAGPRTVRFTIVRAGRRRG
jgi:Tol biopolymer transport system component